MKIKIELINENIKRKYIEINNEELREKIFIYNSYYDFINNEECLLFIEKSFNIFETNELGSNKESRLTLSIIILKSFIDKKFLPHLNDRYIQSDDIFNEVTDQFQKYLFTCNIFIPEKNIQTLVIHAIDLLVNCGLIKQKIIKLYSSEYKTYKHFSLSTGNYYNKHNFIFSFVAFKWLEIGDKFYIYTFHYSKIYEINKKNFNSNKYFKIKDKNYIINKINKELYIDKEYVNDLKNELCLDKKNLDNELTEYLIKLDECYVTDNWNVDTKKNISELQKKISKIQEKLVLYHFMDFDFGDLAIRFPLFLDFRGRKYYFSSIGPTESKILRLCYYYGYYNLEEFNIFENTYSYKYQSEIKKFCAENGYIDDEKYYEHYFWCLVSIGKFFVDKTTFPISLDSFIKCAIDNYKVDIKTLEKKMEIKHYKRIMGSFGLEKIKKRVIIKDATASIYQIFMKKLGPINQLSLNFVNLGEHNEWYDTYLVNRNLFLNSIKDEESIDSELISVFLSRDLIKNMVMIIPYSAGFNLCWNNYLKIIEEKNLNIIIDKNFKKIFKKFYYFLKHNVQSKHFYNKSTDTIIQKAIEEFQESRKFILESPTGDADISYFKMKKSSIDKKYRINGINKRITRLVMTPTTALDLESFNRSSGANIAHFYDAEEIRSIENSLGYHIITIHDSFLIDFKNCNRLISSKIQHYQKSIDKISGAQYKIRNIFILL